ncbi:MAG TPA: sigma-70 family RNA polymerase sigma factor [Bryobacteraceae bacterium]|nr:sigma-70 family RNA polymerase sigma factor [Bryobacteraceae bacterium]
MLLMQSATDRDAVDMLFGELFRRYQFRVTAWCSRLVRDPGRGADLAQEVFLRAFRYRNTFRGDSRLSTWLYAIARNHCINTVRRRAFDPLVNSDEFPPDLADDTENAHTETERAQSFDRLWATMNAALTHTERRVMALHYGHDFSLAAITNHLMLSNPSGAKAYIVNARRKLQRALGNRRAVFSANRCAKIEA